MPRDWGPTTGEEGSEVAGGSVFDVEEARRCSSLGGESCINGTEISSGTEERCRDGEPPTVVLGILISQPDENLSTKFVVGKNVIKSCHEECRICLQQMDEPLLDLGCRCRGGLEKAHVSCIVTWFHTRGNNKCEICQHFATNVPFPVSQPITNYCVWRVDSNYRGSNFGQASSERGCFNPFWVAFGILVGGLLLDVLILISLGVSALPFNIIIGALILLGLGIALRLSMRCWPGRDFFRWRLAGAEPCRLGAP